MAWTEEMVEQLREMWKQGLTTGEIGKRLGVSKNSIVGKVHRLGLSGRPSPIKKKETAASDNAKKDPASQAKPSKSKNEKIAAAKKTEPESELIEDIVIEEKIEIVPPSYPQRSDKTSLTDLDNHTCRWPIGDPKDENFHFCGKKVRIGQTYCDEHAAVAYVKAVKK